MRDRGRFGELLMVRISTSAIYNGDSGFFEVSYVVKDSPGPEHQFRRRRTSPTLPTIATRTDSDDDHTCDSQNPPGSLIKVFFMSTLILLEISNNFAADQGSDKRVTLYSCHVHPDGSRLATGGLGM